MAGNTNNLMAVEIENGVTGNYDYVLTRGFEIVEVTGVCNALDAGTTSTIQTNIALAGFVAVTPAIDVADADDFIATLTLIAAQKTLNAADTIRSVVAGNVTALQSNMYIWVIPTSWIAG